MEKITRCYRYAAKCCSAQGTPTRKEQREASSRRRILRLRQPVQPA
jgi:hypothetical protein